MARLVTPVLLKVAVFIGTIAGVQLVVVFQSVVAPIQVASWVCATLGRNRAETETREQRREAAYRRDRGRCDLHRAVANCGARRSRCRGARGLQTPPIRTHAPTPANVSRRASQ